MASYPIGDMARVTSNGDASDSTGPEKDVVSEEKHTAPSPAEELASSIFQFVKSAASLGTTLCSVASHSAQEDGASFFRSQQGDKLGTDSNKTASDDSEDLQDESQVQLMRLRIKSREVIIFPDPQYLCCVVQRTGKQANAANSR